VSEIREAKEKRRKWKSIEGKSPVHGRPFQKK